MEIKLLSGALGAEISGIDLKDTSAENFEKIKKFLRQGIELGLLLLGLSVFAEILFGPDVAFFGSQVTKNLVELLNTLGDSGIAALIVILALMIVYRRLLK